MKTDTSMEENNTRFFVNTKTGEMEAHSGGLSASDRATFRNNNWKEVSGHYWNSSIPNLYYGALRVFSGNMEWWRFFVLIFMTPFFVLYNFLDFVVFCFNDKGISE